MKQRLFALAMGYLAVFVIVGAYCGVCLLLDGCTTTQATSDDLPHLLCVDTNRNIWRCGQPTKAGFAKLAEMGVTNSLKLNESSEGLDYVTHGELFARPISIEQQIGLAPLPQSMLEGDVSCVPMGTVLHCLHGNDRTGLLVAIYRVRVQGWTPEAAEREMLAQGFHRELLGLWDAWQDFKRTCK